MRGKDQRYPVKLLPDGITPAYAGKSYAYCVMVKNVLGSPPPMRGKVFDSKVSLCCHGITPAYAGKSF